MSFERYRAQLVYEQIGAEAGLRGETREDCPYDKALNPDGWNHWLYGRDVAACEAETIRSGVVEFMNESGVVCFSVPVEEAIRTGQWKPRFAKLPRS